MSLARDPSPQKMSPVAVVKATVAEVRSEQISFIAASLAYYAFISLLPLMLLAIVVASVFGGEELALSLAERATASFGEQAGELVRGTLTGTAGQASAGVVGVVFLLWSGLKLFRGLDIAFSVVYDSPLPDSIVVQIRDALVTLGAVGVGVVITVAVGAAIALVDVGVVAGVNVLSVAGTLLLVGGLTAAFLPLYYFLPARGIGLREALPGALFAGVGWAVLQAGFQIYAANAGSYEAYGVLGGVLLIVTFLYFGGLILLVGVVLNAVLAGRTDGGRNDDYETMTEDRDDGEAYGTRTAASDDGGDGDGGGGGGGPRRRNFSDEYDGDVEAELERLYDELDRFEERFEDGVVHRERIESQLKRYVRGRMRRGKATGWGPYLVLLYGTAMTLGAFFYLSGGWAILAMLVVWLSTLGLYVLMLIVGAGVSAVGLPGKLRDRFGAFRD